MPDDAHSTLATGDGVMFKPAFGDATVVPQPGTLTGSAAKLRVGGVTVCVTGDEDAVSVPGVTYTTATFATPGTGTLTIKPLDGDHLSMTLHDGGKPVLLRSGDFAAVLTVDSPAKTADQKAMDAGGRTYEGTGSFTISGDRKLFSS